MPCDVCERVLRSVRTSLLKVICRRPSDREEAKEKMVKIGKGKTTATERHQGLSSKDPNVAACGDVVGKNRCSGMDSDVDDFDSWTEDEEVFKAEPATNTMENGHTEDITRTIRESTLSERVTKFLESTMEMTRQSEKDIDSMEECLNDTVDGMHKYFDVSDTENAKCQEKGDPALASEDVQSNFEMTKDSGPMDSPFVEVSSLEPSSEEDSQRHGSKILRGMTDGDEQSSVTTTEIFMEDVAGESSQTVSRELELPQNRAENSNDQSAEGDQSPAFEDKGREDTFPTKESHVISEIANSPAAPAQRTMRYHGNICRQYGLVTRRDVTNPSDALRSFTYPGRGRRRGVAKATTRLPVPVSLLAFFKRGCCRSDGRVSLTGRSTVRGKRNRRTVTMRAAGRQPLEIQKSTTSLINTTLCGTFRLIEQPGGANQDKHRTHSLPIPFLFGLRSTYVIPMKGGLFREQEKEKMNSNECTPESDLHGSGEEKEKEDEKEVEGEKKNEKEEEEKGELKEEKEDKPESQTSHTRDNAAWKAEYKLCDYFHLKSSSLDIQTPPAPANASSRPNDESKDSEHCVIEIEREEKQEAEAPNKPEAPNKSNASAPYSPSTTGRSVRCFHSARDIVFDI